MLIHPIGRLHKQFHTCVHMHDPCVRIHSFSAMSIHLIVVMFEQQVSVHKTNMYVTEGFKGGPSSIIPRGASFTDGRWKTVYFFTPKKRGTIFFINQNKFSFLKRMTRDSLAEHLVTSEHSAVLVGIGGGKGENCPGRNNNPGVVQAQLYFYLWRRWRIIGLELNVINNTTGFKLV